MKKLPRIFTLFFCLAYSFAAHAAPGKDLSLRGAERAETRALDPLRAAASGITYIPAKLLDGTLYVTGRTAAELSDEDFVRRVKDLLYFYDEKFLWYPLVDFNSGFRPRYGAGLNFKDQRWSLKTRALVNDSDFYSASAKGVYHGSLGSMEWDNALMVLSEKQDDLRYYGLGADPRDDPRNTFVGDHDYGLYTESRRKIQWESSLYSVGRTLGLTYLGYYQRRAFEDGGYTNNDVREVFDHSRIPGFDAPVRQLYNELALEWDTRDKKTILSPGFRSEVYSGFSAGLGKHNAHLFRTGFDAAGFIPVIRKDRLIVPRFTGDLVENLNDEPIPFSEYPRHHAFRGISTREIIRSERVSITPSIEYQFPLSHMLGAHLFFDTLFVGPRAGSIQWNEGLWAAGAGLDLHYFKHELGRIELAGGSEGFQAKFTIGTPLKTNHRKDW